MSTMERILRLMAEKKASDVYLSANAPALIKINGECVPINNQILPPEAPLTLFVWGPERVLPVRLESLNITEEAHDALLNPVRARVELSLNVLSAHDFKASQPGFYLFMVHQVMKEILAVTNVFNSIQSVGSGLRLT